MSLSPPDVRVIDLDRIVRFVDLTGENAAVTPDVERRWRALLQAGEFVGGCEVEAFEQEWARYCGRTHAVGTANGTDALALALAGLGVGAGDEVLVPANTFIATAEAVSAVGARPVFVDVDPTTLLLTPEAVAAAVTPRAVAVVVVHLFGAVPDIEGLRRVADRAGLALIEDAAQAHGGRRHGRLAGSFGDVAAFSFYPTKNLGAFGDAGAVVTDDRMVADRIRSLGNHGRRAGSPNAHDVVGGNSRLDALQAAVLRVKLPHLDRRVAQRQALAAQYAAQLAGVDVQPVGVPVGSESAYHLFVVRSAQRDLLREMLAADGVATGVHYPVPCHRQPAYRCAGGPALPVAERAAREILSLPLHPGMTEEQVDRVCDVLAQAERAL